jgi:type I restriction enzyme S subunit
MASLLDLAPLAAEPVSQFSGEVGYVATGDVDGDDVSSSEVISFVNRPSRANLRMKDGDVAFARMAATDKAFIVRDGLAELVFSTGFACLRPRPGACEPRYLKHFLRSTTFHIQKDRLATGATQKAITNDGISQIRIVAPALSEQRCIADILDKADVIRRKRKEAIALTEELLRSAFLEMFGDPVTNPKGWPVKPLGELGELDRGRSRHRPRNDPRLLGGAHPLIQTGEVANCDGVIRFYEQTYSDLGLSQSKLWPAGTLCITIAANIAKTGVLAFDACFPDSVVGFTPGRSATTEFVQYWLGFLQPVLERQAPQSAQKNINLEILRKLNVPTPNVERQRQFSEVVRKLRLARNEMRHAGDVSEGLFQTLVARFFAGSKESSR